MPEPKSKKQPQQKFNVGDFVKEKGAPYRDAGEVVGFSYYPHRGYTYRITSEEVSLSEKRIIEGIKVVSENVLEPVKKAEET